MRLKTVLYLTVLPCCDDFANPACTHPNPQRQQVLALPAHARRESSVVVGFRFWLERAIFAFSDENTSIPRSWHLSVMPRLSNITCVGYLNPT